MKVAVIGSGGREHSICTSLKNSNKVKKIYCIPGNAGTSSIAENIAIEVQNFEKIKNFVLNNKKKSKIFIVCQEMQVQTK